MIIDKMNTLENLTNQEKAVVDYIIANPKALLEMSVNELANASYTSASTITRLCKKLGTKGYADMKFIYVSEYPEMMKLKDSLKVVPFSRNSGIDDIIHTMPLIYSRAIDHTRSMLDRNTVIRVSNLMKRAQVIDLYGDGSLMTTRDMMTVNIMGRRQGRDFQEDRAHPIIRGLPMTSVLQRKKEAC